MNLKRELSSYRDPDGYIAYEGDEIYRCVLNDDAPVLLPQYQDFFKEAVKRDWLVPFEKSDSENAALKLEKLPLITYPYEWGFAQLKEAALLTLDIALLALEHGLSLKDATAFNIQQKQGRMIFIDHTSFEPSDNKLPWHAYSQFCRHFLAPLLMTSRTGRNGNKSFLVNLEGPGLDEAAAALRLGDRFKPSLFIHIFLHNLMINAMKGNEKERTIREQRTGNQKNFLKQLRQTVEGIAPPRYDTEWHNYYNKTNYEEQSFRTKEQAIKKMLVHKKYSCIWDMGGNNGHFSRIMAQSADLVLSMDIDYAAIDLNYLENRRQGLKNIYPVVMDFANPSPALGFGNMERGTIDTRSKPDMIFALALIHHLTVTYNIPFATQAEKLRAYNAELVIEYVDREDSQFKRLLRSKQNSYEHYTRKNFEASFLKFFRLVRKDDIPGTFRTLYHFRPQ